VDLTSYAELAVRLVNTAFRADDEADALGTTEAFRLFVADRPHLAGQITRYDLDVLRLLRAEFRRIFTAAAEGAETDAVECINALLIQHPVHPELVGHDTGRWHLHLSETGSVADRYAAGAVIGMAMLAAQLGVNRLGVCAIASCHGVFIDASTNRSRRYCADHCTARANVTAIGAQRRTGNASPAATAAS
jgi:predicted RNA-binding Zn ribbon-like protein